MRVAVVSAEGPGSPSLAVRTALPADALRRLGLELEPRLLFDRRQADRFAAGGPLAKAAVAAGARRRLRTTLAAEVGDFDSVLVHRRADPLPSLAVERAARAGRRLVYDVDDALWHERALKAGGRKSRWLAERADHVIAGNSILAEHLARHAEALTVVPSLVDTGLIERREHADSEELVLGWIGSRTTAPFVARLRPVIERLAGELGDARLRLLMVGGSTEPPAGVELESRPWSDAAQADALRRMDVGLMPLPDTPWNRGKCAYKALQYMAAGIPVAADDVGVAAEVVGPGGVVVGPEGEWREPLRELLLDATLRERLGARGRARVESDYSVERWAPVLAEVIAGRAERTT